MSFKRLAAMLVAAVPVFLGPVQAHAQPVGGPAIREGDAWNYLKGTSTPLAQGGNQWHSPAYDDSAWSGPAPSGFGYGDCDDATDPGDMQGHYASLYIRRKFVVDDVSTITRLTLGIDYDDGAVIYLNGNEVMRLNMPAGVVYHDTVAAGNHEASRGEGSSNPPATPKEFYALDPSLLVNGTNIIAASVHNRSAGSSDCTLIVELYTNASLTRGPFIQMPDAGNRAAIVWNTAALVDSVVDYGLDPACSSGTVSNGTPKREHAVLLSGLLPGTSYYYRVRGHGEVLSAGKTFRTRPSPAHNFRFVVIGDHGQGTTQMRDIAARINARTDFDAILTVGDNIYGRTPCSLDGAPGWYDPFWFRLYEPTMGRVATFPALGNHDWDTASGRYMVDYFHLPANGPANHREKNYSFEFGNMHVVVLDTEPYHDTTTAAIQEINAWLEADLAAATQAWKIALLHRPPFTSRSSTHGDNPRVKEHLVPRLKAGGVQVVFQGHNHWYERINAIDGIQYITTAGAGAGLYDVVDRREYSARWAKEFSYTMVDVQGKRMTIQQVNINGNVIDEHRIDIGHPFSMDGLLDNASWLRASNGMNLYAAIRGPCLYVATQDAGEGSDHFMYVAGQLGDQRAVNWAKTGSVMAWGSFLADENDGAFHGWYGPDGAMLNDFNVCQSMTSGTNNNAPQANGVLEGTLDLAARFGSIPPTLYVSAAAYGTADGGILNVQVPSGNGDGNITGNEFIALNPRDIALDLPVANAGNAFSIEAGLWASLDGSASASPAGLPLTWHWEQTGGPAVLTTNLHLAQASFVISSNVPVNTAVTFRLRVHDGRFFSDESVVTVTLLPMLDGDGDGLSDQEEITGKDNILTKPDPAGRFTNPQHPDSDGDRASDGSEAGAGTDPNDASSTLKILDSSSLNGGEFVLLWEAISGRQYRAEYNHLPVSNGWSELAQVTATGSPAMALDPEGADAAPRYYRIAVDVDK